MRKDEHTYLQIAAKKDEPGYDVQTYRRTSFDSYISIYSDYVACMKDQRAFRFITPGLCMSERQAAIVDFDIPYRDELKQLFLDQCREYGLALPNYILINNERKLNPDEMYHFQVGWLFDKPLRAVDQRWSGSSESRTYTDLLAILTYLFTLGEDRCSGDFNFRGSRIRNPYCDYNQRVIWLDENRRTSLSDFLAKAKELDSEKMILKAVKDLRKPTNPGNKNIENLKDSSSRNCMGLAKACSFIRRYRMEFNAWPTLELVIKVVEEAEWDVVALYPEKGRIEDPTTIKRVAEAALRYMNESYRYMPSTSERRELSLYVRRVEKAYNVMYFRLLKQQGILQKDIASEMERNKVSISRWANDTTPQEVYVQQLQEFVQRDIRSEKAKNLEGKIIELFTMMEDKNAI